MTSQNTTSSTKEKTDLGIPPNLDRRTKDRSTPETGSSWDDATDQPKTGDKTKPTESPAPVAPPELADLTLDDIEHRLQKGLADFEQFRRATGAEAVDRMAKLGNLAREAKRKCGHGEFGKWKKKFGPAARTIEEWMQIAEAVDRGEIDTKNAAAAEFPPVKRILKDLRSKRGTSRKAAARTTAPPTVTQSGVNEPTRRAAGTDPDAECARIEIAYADASDAGRERFHDVLKAKYGLRVQHIP